MARETHDREDLLLEGVNLPERARLLHRASGREWVVGWRTGGGPAFYDGPDRVYQFNADNQLRRVYLDGSKLAAEGGRLCELRRPEPTNPDGSAADRTRKVKLVWQPIDSAIQQNVLEQWAETRQQMLTALERFRERDLSNVTIAATAPDGSNSTLSTQTSIYIWESVGVDAFEMLDRTSGWLVSITDNPEIAAQPNA
ncbi:hypothetical protein [Rhodopirellula bahusiensis]|uniref:hypothetical protein n=1 Tax=Rhodopirellula bahusiensis TaxID=2014065 RepID=UPI003266CE2C